MIERAALYPKYLHFLLKLRSKVYTVVAPLSAKAALSREPVPFSQIGEKQFDPIEPGTAWGSDFDCAWFDFEGEVPAAAKGKKVVALIDVQGEGLVYIDGKPVVARKTAGRPVRLRRGRRKGETSRRLRIQRQAQQGGL